ncbi:MAG: DUF4111 domain-containing protein, partial [Tetrasphaera sp.]|nr:DUF4111 domain-containing protein [Tetrasphaera sp.]
AVLDDLVAAARQILGDRFVGAYLHGSLAQGDADLESDADFLIITDGPVDEEQFVALARLHHRLAHGESHWTRHLEGSYAVAAELRSLSGVGRASWPYVDHGSDRLEISNHCDTIPARVILHENGIALAGPSATTVVPPVPGDLVVADAAAGLAEWLPDLDEWAFTDAWSQRYSVLNLARMVAAHETGQVLSKRAAAGWAATLWGGEFAPLLEAMVAARGATAFDDPADPAWIPQQHAFFAAVAARSGS